jgi:TolB-like protein/DNA-binding winged helix-turn-helix (wHTH) protein/Flp pilus assembly protein TadD
MTICSTRLPAVVRKITRHHVKYPVGRLKVSEIVGTAVNDAAPDAIFEFGEFLLDSRRRTVHRRSDGESLDLTPRVFATLLHLVEHAGHLVDKRALMAAVWPNTVVEESSLTQAIHALRRGLGEHPDDHRFIVTVPGRGYRFVADVATRRRPEVQTTSDRQAAPPDIRHGWCLAGPAGGIAVLLALFGMVFYATSTGRRSNDHAIIGARPAITVLPFVDLSPAEDYAFFADGLSEEVLNLLSHAPDLTVIARTSSFSFRDRNADIATIARALDVGYVLEGSVRRDGGRVRITAQLIDAASSSHLWSETYDRELGDVFAVQTEIAGAVTSALHARLTNRAQKGMALPRNTQAYDDFLRGQFFYGRRGPGDLERALRYYERSLGVDPEYARAWAGVAAVVNVQTAHGRMPRSEGLPRLLEAARKVVALDPGMPEGHLRLARYYSMVGEKGIADGHYRKALALGPANPLTLGFQAGAAAQRGRIDEAIELQRRAAAADTLSAVAINNLGYMLFAAGRLEEAKVELIRSAELSPESGAEGTVGQILVLQREFEAARALIEQLKPGLDREQGLALVYYALGNEPDADAALDRLTEMSATEDPFRIAEVYAYRGDAGQSFKWLALATRPIDPEGMVLPGARNLWEMRASPLLSSLHADPRWSAWVGGPS